MQPSVECGGWGEEWIMSQTHMLASVPDRLLSLPTGMFHSVELCVLQNVVHARVWKFMMKHCRECSFSRQNWITACLQKLGHNRKRVWKQIFTYPKALTFRKTLQSHNSPSPSPAQKTKQWSVHKTRDYDLTVKILCQESFRIKFELWFIFLPPKNTRMSLKYFTHDC